MQTYRVFLDRTYSVDIEAENEDDAKMYSESFLGDLPDRSNEQERLEKHFQIKDIEMRYNEAFEVHLIGEDGEVIEEDVDDDDEETSD